MFLENMAFELSLQGLYQGSQRNRPDRSFPYKYKFTFVTFIIRISSCRYEGLKVPQSAICKKLENEESWSCNST